MSNLFYTSIGPIKISEILNILNLKIKVSNIDQSINDIKDLYTAQSNDITFFHSKKYNHLASNTKAAYCITTESLKNNLPKNCTPLIVENVLVSTSIVTTKFYPDSINDNFDNTAEEISKTSFRSSNC